MDLNKQNSLYRANKAATLFHPKIRANQLAFLQAVALKPGSTQTELCQELGVTMSAISRNVDVFGSGKAKSKRHKCFALVKAERDQNDERLVLIYLTDEGEAFLELIENVVFKQS